MSPGTLTTLPFLSLCTAVHPSWPVACDELDFLADAGQGCPQQLFLPSPHQNAASRKPALSKSSKSRQGNGLPPPLIRGRGLLSAGRLGPQQGLGGAKEGQKGNSPAPGEHTVTATTEATAHCGLSPGAACVLLFLPSDAEGAGGFPGCSQSWSAISLGRSSFPGSSGEELASSW